MNLVKPGHRDPFCERAHEHTISHHLCSIRRRTSAKVSPEHGPYDRHRIRQCPRLGNVLARTPTPTAAACEEACQVSTGVRRRAWPRPPGLEQDARAPLLKPPPALWAGGMQMRWYACAGPGHAVDPLTSRVRSALPKLVQGCGPLIEPASAMAVHLFSACDVSLRRGSVVGTRAWGDREGVWDTGNTYPPRPTPGPLPGNRHGRWSACDRVSHGLHGDVLLQEQLDEERAEPHGIHCGCCPPPATQVHSTAWSWTTTTGCTSRLALQLPYGSAAAGSRNQGSVEDDA